MVQRFLLVLLVVVIWSGSGSAATIELARRADGTKWVGVKIEGAIVAGDALKLLEIYKYYGTAAASTVYLMSKGGDVEEAMNMGRLIRRLRLETRIPLHLELPSPVGLAFAANKDNLICASACFLIFAGGITRGGDYLVLHRPYLSKSAADLTDVAYEMVQKKEMIKVGAYLQEMEVEQFYIDKVMSTSSQDGYVVTVADLIAHPLDKIGPWIEEMVLSRSW